MKLTRFALALVSLVASSHLALAQNQSPRPADPVVTKKDEPRYRGLKWREVGPYRGGRVAAVEGIPSQRNTYYFGATGGGVWKTTDGGTNWSNVSDGFFGGAIGAVAVAPSDPNVVYVGGGEKTVRGNVSHGEGMWKSVDAGKSWTFSGLADSRHIPRVRIHPQNPDLVYAAVLGHLFGPNQMRGVYRSRDGGKSWDRVLFANENAGAIDLVLDPTNPRVLYASTWRVRRTPYSLESGGEGSAMWKSTDGGDTWKNLSFNKGLPKGTLGIIGLAVSPSDAQNVYAIIEAEEGGVFRSRDGGETWEKTSDSRDLRQRAWYYTRIYADPKDADTVYVVNVRFHKSKDGGKSFTAIPTPHGDNHDLWIDPNDPLRMIESNDGGANVSLDGGASWTRQDNQPTAQFYRVSTDNDFPYRLLGGQQDNSAVRIRHRSTGAGIDFKDWDETAGSESGHIVAHPANPDVVFGGSYGGYLTVLNHRTGEFRDVNVWPDNPMGGGAIDARERFQWNFPLLFSPHDPDTLYAASQHLWRTTNGGSQWQRISGDLTRNDPSKMGPSGGPITKDNTSVEYYGTIFAIAESPRERGVIWAGSDDGLIHLTRDNGTTWKNVTPRAMPQWIQINSIDASPFDAGTAYVAGTMYKSDDFRPYLYRTTDFGATWTRIDSGIARDHFTRAIRSDNRRKGLLYAGTERGMYVSYDDGARWEPLQLNLPIVPITDIAVKNDDVIVATQGRGFWILDNVTPLQQWSADVERKPVHLFAPRASHRIQAYTASRPPKNQGTNPPNGAVVDFHITEKPGTKLKLAFLTADDKVIREYSGEVVDERPEEEKRKAEAAKEAEQKATAEAAAPREAIRSEGGASEKNVKGEEEEKTPEEKKREEENKLPEIKRGLNRYAWNLRHPDARKFEGMILWGGGTDGPRVPPGSYKARLTVGDRVETVPFEVVADPRSSTAREDIQLQYETLLEIRNKLDEVHTQIERIREVRKQLAEVKRRVAGSDSAKSVRDAATELDKKMTAVEETLYQTKSKSAQDPLNFPIRLNDKLASLGDSIATGDHAPTAQALSVKRELIASIDRELEKLRTIFATELPRFNQTVREAEVPVVHVR